MIRRPPRSPPFPSTPLSRSGDALHEPPRSRADEPARLLVPPARDTRAVAGRATPPSEFADAASPAAPTTSAAGDRSEEHTSELQSRQYLVCRLLLEKKKINT